MMDPATTVKRAFTLIQPGLRQRNVFHSAYSREDPKYMTFEDMKDQIKRASKRVNHLTKDAGYGPSPSMQMKCDDEKYIRNDDLLRNSFLLRNCPNLDVTGLNCISFIFLSNMYSWISSSPKTKQSPAKLSDNLIKTRESWQTDVQNCRKDGCFITQDAKGD
jgi:hypothetical protein